MGSMVTGNMGSMGMVMNNYSLFVKLILENVLYFLDGKVRFRLTI